MIQYLADDNVVNSNAVERPVRVWVYELNSLYFPLKSKEIHKISQFMRDLLIKIQTYRYNSYSIYMSHILYRQVSSCNLYRQDYVLYILCIIC